MSRHSRGFSNWLAAGCLFAGLAMLTGCGGGGSSPPPPPPTLTITTTTLGDGVAGTAYSVTLQATGGTGTRTWSLSAGSLPGGLTLSSAGAITGTPAAAGTFNFTVSVTDQGTPQQSDTQALSIRIADPLVITTTTLPDGTVGTAYSQTLAATGGITPLSWSVASGALPGGLTLDPASGAISGTPTGAGAFTFTVQVQDSSSPAQSTSQSLTITIIDAVVITTTTLPDATVNTAYSQVLAAIGGTTPYSWLVTAGTLPAGITLAADGTLSGTPTTAGTSNFTVQAQDSSSPALTDTQDLSLTVNTVAAGRNDTIATATTLSNGRVAASISPYPAPGSADKPDVDVYQITGTAGATVTIEIFAMRLAPASPLDSMIQIVDSTGTQLTTCNDGAGNFTAACFNDDLVLGVDRDSRLELQVPAGTTTFFVRVLSWSGGARPDFLYEIEITGAN